MSWRRFFGLEGEGAKDASGPRLAGLRVVSLRSLGPEPVVVAREGSRSELRLLAASAPYRAAGACLVVAGGLAGDGLAPSGPRDVLLGVSASPLSAGPSGAVVLSASGAGAAPRSLARLSAGTDAGEGLAGVTGARLVGRGGGIAVLRLGPPPGARWEVTGLHALALFAGKVAVIDGDAPVEALAWEAVLVTDPSVPVHLVAGNDSFRGVAFAAEGVAVALG